MYCTNDLQSKRESDSCKINYDVTKDYLQSEASQSSEFVEGLMTRYYLPGFTNHRGMRINSIFCYTDGSS